MLYLLNGECNIFAQVGAYSGLEILLANFMHLKIVLFFPCDTVWKR